MRVNMIRIIAICLSAATLFVGCTQLPSSTSSPQRPSRVDTSARASEIDQSIAWRGQTQHPQQTQQPSQPPANAGASGEPNFWGFLTPQATTQKDELGDPNAARERLGQPPRVGLLLPLSGQHAAIGQALLKTAQLRVFNADSDVQLLPFDTQGSPEGAGSAVDMAMANQVDVVIGPLFAHEVPPVARRLQFSPVNALALTNDESVLDSGVFSLGMAAPAQAERLLQFASAQGIKKIAVLAPDNLYGQTALQAIENAASRADVAVVKVQLIKPNARNFTEDIKQLADYATRQQALQTEIARIKNLQSAGQMSKAMAERQLKELEERDTYGEVDYQGLIIADFGQRLRQLLPLLPYYDINPRVVQYMGFSQWEDVVANSKEEALMGAWYTAPDPQLRQQFIADYQSAYAATPPRLATLVYDALGMILQLDRQGLNFSRSELEGINNYQGLDGQLQLESGDVAKRSLAMMRVTRSGPKVIDPAPPLDD